jgi:hypothetical protein
MATTTITKTETLVGKRIRRKEDPRLITGTLDPAFVVKSRCEQWP